MVMPAELPSCRGISVAIPDPTVARIVLPVPSQVARVAELADAEGLNPSDPVGVVRVRNPPRAR